MVVPDEKPLTTPRDAGAYIAAPPKDVYDAPAWQSGMFVLIHAADRGGPKEFARLGMVQALNPRATV
jgi:hypothetical protein